MKQGEASSTARVIAASTLLLASDAKTAGLVAPGAAELSRQFLSLSPVNRWLDVVEVDHPATQRVKRQALETGPMEGVLMYLPVADVERILERLSAAAPARLRLVFTFMSKWPDGSSGFRPRSWLIERCVNRT